MGDLADKVLNGPDAMICRGGPQPVRMLKSACIKRQAAARLRVNGRIALGKTNYETCLDCDKGKEIFEEMGTKECSVESCHGVAKTWGLCQNHYYKWRKNEPEMVEIMGCDYEDRKVAIKGDGNMAANIKNNHQDSEGEANEQKGIPMAGSPEKEQKKPLILDFSEAYDGYGLYSDLEQAAWKDYRTPEGQALFYIAECLRKRALNEKIKKDAQSRGFAEPDSEA